jgi:small subunit ribosomal protein S11
MAQTRPQLLLSMCRSCRQSSIKQSKHPYQKQARRALTTTSPRHADDYESPRPRSSLHRRMGIRPLDTTPAPPINPAKLFADQLPSSNRPQRPTGTFIDDLGKITDRPDYGPALNPQQQASATGGTGAQSAYLDEPYHITVYAIKHNTHLVFSEPSRNPILSLSCGSLGLRRAQRSTYDAAFQLCAYFFRKMAEKQWKIGGSKDPYKNKNPWQTIENITRPVRGGSYGLGIEVVLRGFGPGREAFQKALLGTEGRKIKPLIGRVTDATRLKFGGTRSPQVRRLG